MTAGQMAAGLVVLLALGLAVVLRAVARREERIRQEQWWRSWQREQYGRGGESDE